MPFYLWPRYPLIAAFRDVSTDTATLPARRRRATSCARAARFRQGRRNRAARGRQAWRSCLPAGGEMAGPQAGRSAAPGVRARPGAGRGWPGPAGYSDPWLRELAGPPGVTSPRAAPARARWRCREGWSRPRARRPCDGMSGRWCCAPGLSSGPGGLPGMRLSLALALASHPCSSRASAPRCA